MRRRGGLVCVVAGAIAVACTSPVGVDRMVPERLPVVRKTEASVAVAPVTSQEEAPFTLGFEPNYWIGNEEFETALVEALSGSGLFRSVADPGSGDYELRTHVVSQQWQATGVLTTSASLVVNYRLLERATGRELWHDTIITSAIGDGTRLGHGLSGAARQSLSRAAQQSLVEMLKRSSAKLP